MYLLWRVANMLILFSYFKSCAARVGYMTEPLQHLTISDVFLPDHCPVRKLIIII
jgi:hypothetical protein